MATIATSLQITETNGSAALLDTASYEDAFMQLAHLCQPGAEAACVCEVFDGPRVIPRCLQPQRCDEALLRCCLRAAAPRQHLTGTRTSSGHTLHWVGQKTDGSNHTSVGQQQKRARGKTGLDANLPSCTAQRSWKAPKSRWFWSVLLQCCDGCTKHACGKGVGWADLPGLETGQDLVPHDRARREPRRCQGGQPHRVGSC